MSACTQAIPQGWAEIQVGASLQEQTWGVTVSHHISTDSKKKFLSFYTSSQINACNNIDQFLRMWLFPRSLNYEPQFEVIHFSTLLQFHTTLSTAEVLNKKLTGEKETSPPFPALFIYFWFLPWDFFPRPIRLSKITFITYSFIKCFKVNSLLGLSKFFSVILALDFELITDEWSTKVAITWDFNDGHLRINKTASGIYFKSSQCNKIYIRICLPDFTSGEEMCWIREVFFILVCSQQQSLNKRWQRGKKAVFIHYLNMLHDSWAKTGTEQP